MVVVSRPESSSPIVQIDVCVARVERASPRMVCSLRPKRPIIWLLREQPRSSNNAAAENQIVRVNPTSRISDEPKPFLRTTSKPTQRLSQVNYRYPPGRVRRDPLGPAGLYPSQCPLYL
jgi:hypothetical protein